MILIKNIILLNLSIYQNIFKANANNIKKEKNIYFIY